MNRLPCQFIRIVCLTVALLSGAANAQTTDTCKITEIPPATPSAAAKNQISKSKEDNRMFLSRVVCEVEQALDVYQQSADVEETGLLPKLATADFEFQTVVDTKDGFTISFLILRFGSTVEKQYTNDVDFQYVPKSLLKSGFEARRAKSLQDELIDTIRSSARAIVDQSKMPAPGTDPLTFRQLTVTLSFGVTWDVNGGVNAPIHLVTVGGSLDRSKNNVQQVRLVFAPPPKKPKSEEKEE